MNCDAVLSSNVIETIVLGAAVAGVAKPTMQVAIMASTKAAGEIRFIRATPSKRATPARRPTGQTVGADRTLRNQPAGETTPAS